MQLPILIRFIGALHTRRKPEGLAEAPIIRKGPTLATCASPIQMELMIEALCEYMEEGPLPTELKPNLRKLAYRIGCNLNASNEVLKHN